MRVVDRKAFMKLPAGTVYAKGVKFAFNGLNIKHENTGPDMNWYSFDPCWIETADGADAFVQLENMLTQGISHPMIESVARDNMFDKEHIFLIFERVDLLLLRNMIDAAITLPPVP